MVVSFRDATTLMRSSAIRSLPFESRICKMAVPRVFSCTCLIASSTVEASYTVFKAVETILPPSKYFTTECRRLKGKLLALYPLSFCNCWGAKYGTHSLAIACFLATRASRLTRAYVRHPEAFKSRFLEPARSAVSVSTSFPNSPTIWCIIPALAKLWKIYTNI